MSTKRENYDILPRSKAYQEAVVRALSARQRHNHYYVLPFDEKLMLRDSKYGTNWNAIHSEPFTSLVSNPMMSAHDFKPLSQAIHLCPAQRFNTDVKPQVQRIVLEKRYSTVTERSQQQLDIDHESRRALQHLRLFTPRTSAMPTRTAPLAARRLPASSARQSDARLHRDDVDVDKNYDPELSKEKMQRLQKWLTDGAW